MRAIKKGSLVLLAAGALTWQACDPPGPAALLRGERLIQSGRYAGAIEALREATSLLPDNPQAWNHLGLAHHWAREYNPAVQAYRQALKLNYDLAPARFNLGSLLLEINQPDLAAAEFAAYTELKPEQAGGWVRRGMAEWRSRNWNAAHESFQTALRLDTAQPVVWNSIGVIELYRRNHMAAFNAFKEALRYQPDYAPAVYNSALVAQFHLPREPDDPRPYALNKYREYLALTPRPLFTDAVDQLARRLDAELNPKPAPVTAPPPPPAPTNAPVQVAARGDSNIVTPAPTKPAEIPPPPVKPIALPVEKPVVKEAVSVGAPTETIPPKKPDTAPAPPVRVALKATSVRDSPTPPAPAVAPPAEKPTPPPTSTADKVASQLDAILGMKPAAETAPPPPAETTPSVRDIVPNYTGLNYAYYNPPAPSAGFRHKAKPYFEEGRRRQRLGHFADAVTAYQRAIHWDGAYFEAYHNLGLAAAHTQDFLRAAVAYETALALQPQSAATRYNFALLLSGKGYHRDAAVELEKLLQQSTDDARAHLLLATLYDKHLGQVAKARRHYAEVLRLNPGHSQGTAIRYWLRSH